MASLASVDELQTFMGVSVTLDPSQAQMLLDIASATIRSFTRQTLSLVEDDELTVAANWSDGFWLPERPVVEVGSVTIDGTLLDSSAYSLRTGDQLFFPSGISCAASEAVIVYSHGWADADMPWDIKGDCLALAKQGIRSVSTGGITQETVGPDSITYDTKAAGRLTDEMKVNLKDYRPAITSAAIA